MPLYEPKEIDRIVCDDDLGIKCSHLLHDMSRLLECYDLHETNTTNISPRHTQIKGIFIVNMDKSLDFIYKLGNIFFKEFHMRFEIYLYESYITLNCVTENGFSCSFIFS